MRVFVCQKQRMLRALHGRWPYRRSHCRHDLHWHVLGNKHVAAEPLSAPTEVTEL